MSDSGSAIQYNAISAPASSSAAWRRFVDSAEESDDHKALIEGYLRLRARCVPIAGQIASDMPEYTLHDVPDHADYLWLLCDEVADVELLTHTELFVLGCAFLLHDLGHTPPAYGGLEALRQRPEWATELALQARASSFASGENPDETEVDKATMRSLHAAQAIAMATNQVEVDGAPLMDVEFESEFGQAIGEVAASHHRDVGELFDIFGAHDSTPTGFPASSKYNRLKIAGLLRLIDYAHLDRKRAPSELYRSVREGMPGESRKHWDLQERLDRPSLNHESKFIEFSSGSRPFLPAEAEAWWLGLTMLRGFDTEIRSVRRLFAQNGIDGLKAVGVASVDSPLDLRSYLRTEGWEPIEARISAATPLRLIELFADNRPTVLEGMRELVQNACDASRAFAALSGDISAPPVHVSYADDGHDFVVSVTDHGIGIRAQFLSKSLLKFGDSTWVSRAAEAQYPGLAETNFSPSGRYGIGFFGAFSVGETVVVISRHMHDSVSDAKALELLKNRLAYPIIRELSDDERTTLQRGTIVTVTGPSLAQPHWWGPGHVPNQSGVSPRALGEALSVAFVATDVDLHLSSETDGEEWFVRADSWRSLEDEQLLGVLVDDSAENYFDVASDEILDFVPLVEMGEQGRIVGRAQISPLRARNLMSPSGFMFDGGALLQSVDFISGLIEGRADSSQRNKGRVRASSETCLLYTSPSPRDS